MEVEERATVMRTEHEIGSQDWIEAGDETQNQEMKTPDQPCATFAYKSTPQEFLQNPYVTPNECPEDEESVKA